eukprot:2308131-Amphidinium_carterae.1
MAYKLLANGLNVCALRCGLHGHGAFLDCLVAYPNGCKWIHTFGKVRPCASRQVDHSTQKLAHTTWTFQDLWGGRWRAQALQRIAQPTVHVMEERVRNDDRQEDLTMQVLHEPTTICAWELS